MRVYWSEYIGKGRYDSYLGYAEHDKVVRSGEVVGYCAQDGNVGAVIQEGNDLIWRPLADLTVAVPKMESERCPNTV